ncbi:MAG: class I SAM-dependent methyltransferase [Terriglobia bacterium]
MYPATRVLTPFSKSAEYEQALAAEVRVYEDRVDIHDLPPVFHYWSTHHVLPALNALGVAGPTDLFLQNLVQETPGRRRFASLGAGNCDLEISLALALRKAGHDDFVLDCLELNPAMLERARLSARRAGVEDLLAFVQSDLNHWIPQAEYDAVIANQSLHHVLSLESLFGEIKRALRPGGRFVISDIIGRNGHLRWPEALEIVHEFWRKLPPSYRWNRRALCYEEIFADHDCSCEGFEGVRAQDILPLLLNDFHFRFFFPFGNAIDPFIDRSFGPNFDVSRECDRAFIDRVHQCDEAQIASGRLSPTHMMAVVSAEPAECCAFPGNLSPSFCLRPSARASHTVVFPGPVYQWRDWPDTPVRELEKTCAMLVDSAGLVRRQTAWAHDLERESSARLVWAHDLERESSARLAWGESLERQLDERTAWAKSLDRDMQARTAWALSLCEQTAELTTSVGIIKAHATSLQADVEDRTLWAERLQEQLNERTRWALRLEADLAEQTRRAAALDREIHGYLRNPLRLLLRMMAGIRKRLTG